MNDVFPRFSRTEQSILTHLIDGGEAFGLQIVDRSRGAVKRGTVYVTLQRMEDKGYVESHVETPAPGAIGLPRRFYRPTPYGVAVFNAWTRAARSLARLRPTEA